ncbi:MAG: hypothetical protein FWF76_04000 [Oscillospiraceae bacterium]|nr:hypothetical protein [Oscillospiraceae bacterium]
MSKFTGWLCPACDNVFNEKDDVVVCPDCGTPHHRVCYAEMGECINHSRHGQIEALERILSQYSENEKRQESLREQNDESAPNEHHAYRRKFDSFEGMGTKYERSSASEKQNIFGVSSAELSAFMNIDPDSPEFENKVMRVRPIGFNLFAGFLSPFYQFYKGMRLVGFSLLLLQILMFAMGGAFAITILMLIFHDYIELRHNAFKIRAIRKLYSLTVPKEERENVKYHDFLKMHGKPSIIRGIIETIIATLLLIFILQRFGIELPTPMRVRQ